MMGKYNRLGFEGEVMKLAKKNIVILSLSLAMICAVTFSARFVKYIDITAFQIIAAVFLNVLNGLIAWTAMKITGMTVDVDFKNKRQYLVGAAIALSLSAVIAIIQYQSSVTFIAQLMGISWGALAGAFLGPFLYSLYSKKISKLSVWCSFICGVGLTTGNMILGFFGAAPIASPINAGAIAMILSLIIVPLVSIITPKLPAKFTDEIFACFDEKVWTTRKNSLED